jgi:GNAT superfamily N-acetyltransferase
MSARRICHSVHVSSPGLQLRTSVPSDAERLGRAVAAGFQGYRAFAPDGWTPRPVGAEIEQVRPLLDSEDFWCLLAIGARDMLAGHVAFLTANRAWRAPEDADPGLAHLRQLFVAPGFWGTGLARTLHARAVQAACRRGFTAIRLFTPIGQARARRFYEREGWTAHGESFCDPGFGLRLIEYRRPLP